jgi:hypothetical protein
MRIITIAQQKAMIEEASGNNQIVSSRKTAIQFAEEVVVAARDKILGFFKGMWQHIESVIILTLSSFGLSALLGELPFWLTLPWWVEAAMVIPLFSVVFIIGLLLSAERRAKARMVVA